MELVGGVGMVLRYVRTGPHAHLFRCEVGELYLTKFGFWQVNTRPRGRSKGLWVFTESEAGKCVHSSDGDQCGTRVKGRVGGGLVPVW